MAIAKFGRVITAMITPFKENGDVIMKAHLLYLNI